MLQFSLIFEPYKKYQNIKINQTIKFIPVSKSKMNRVNKFKIHIYFQIIKKGLCYLS